jgi:hypothetical protein
MHPTGQHVTNPLTTRRAFWTLAILTWALAMLVGVVGVGVFIHASIGAFVFTACLLTGAVALWLSSMLSRFDAPPSRRHGVRYVLVRGLVTRKRGARFGVSHRRQVARLSAHPEPLCEGAAAASDPRAPHRTALAERA